MVRFYRSFLLLFCFLFFGVGASVISFLIFPYIRFTKPEKIRKMLYAQVVHNSWRFFINFLQKIKLMKFNCNNKELLSKLSGKVIVASHPTFIDIVVLIALIPNSTCLAKKETLKNPFFSNIVKSLYIINDVDLEEFKAETDRFLKAGFNIIIFPTGTRTKIDDDVKLHKGSAVIAINSNTGIIPVKITTDYPFLQKNLPIYDMGNRVINYNVEVKDEILSEQFVSLTEIKKRNEIMRIIKKEI